jgi:hypothetical protein
MTDSMHPEPKPATDTRLARPKPGRFTLRELLIATALVCVVAGLYSWASENEVLAVLFVIAIFVTIAFIIHTITR